MDLTLNECKIVRKLVEIVNANAGDQFLMYQDTQNRIVRGNDSSVEVQCGRDEFRAVQAAGFVELIGTASTGIVFNLADSAHLAARNNFGRSERLDVLRAFYELSGEAHDGEVYAKDASDLAGLSIGKVKSAMRSLIDQGFIHRDGSSDTFGSPRDPLDRDWYITGAGIMECDEPARAPAVVQTTNYHAPVANVTGGNVQQVWGAHNTATQGIDSAALQQLMKFTSEMMVAARGTGNADLVEKLETLTGDLKDGKPGDVGKVADVVKVIGAAAEAMGSVAEAVPKIGKLLLHGGAWAMTAYAWLHGIPLPPIHLAMPQD
jgi:hypothetical protein